jgi:membrane protease YdiL (CAAX protease family)
LLVPNNFQIQFNPASFFVLVAISLLLIPFQTTYEELFFRGYLAQGVAAWTRNRWMVLIIPSFIFGLLHVFNPEVKEFGFWLTMPQYWLFGLFFGLVSILDDGIELAMGVHAANNIFASVMVTHSSSVLQTDALFSQQKVNPLHETLSFILIGIVFIFLLSRKYNWNFGVMRMTVVKEEIIPEK